MTYRKQILCLSIILQIFLTVCSDRVETPSMGENSTQIYRSKSANGIEATITFCERISKQTSDPVNERTIFTIKDKVKVYAVVNLINRKYHEDKDLMFHIDWLDSTGNSFFKKRIDLTASDSSSSLISLINISPDKRQAGNYSLRVYLFRELIAEKKFELINPVKDTISVITRDIAGSLKARITFCHGISKKTGKLIDAGNKFIIKDKAKVLAIINLENADTSNQNLTFYAEWIGPDDISFYRKKIEVTPKSTSFTISSAISTSHKKRQPGKYLLNVYIFEKLIAEEKFELIKTEKKENILKTKLITENILANIFFCEKVSKKTGEPIYPDTVFTMNDKKNVKAVIYIEKQDTNINQPMNFLIDWHGPDGNSFYKKKIELLPHDSTSAITSSISISPEKRKPGYYLLRVYLSKKLIGEKKFLLKENSPL